MENYNLITENFDTKERIERAKVFANELRNHIVDGKNKSAIDFGCGTGLVGLELINDFNSITFIDSSASMIKQVEQKLHNIGIRKSQVICCDIMKVMPNNLSVDYIFSSLVLHHIADTESIFTCLFSLLNKNGHLLIIDLDVDDGSFHAKHSDYDGHNGFEQIYLGDLCKKVGFRKTEIGTFYHGCKTVNGNEKPYSCFIMDATK